MTVSLPPFLDQYGVHSDAHPLNIQSKELLTKNWLTDDLITEIDALAPTDADIINSTENEHSLHSFMEKCAILFPEGRHYASFKQLHQVAKKFMAMWAISCVHEQKKILCHYSDSHTDAYKKRKLVLLGELKDNKRCVKKPTMKEQCKCPFFIRYTFVNKVVDLAYGKPKPDVFHIVRITAVNYTHHPFSPVEHRFPPEGITN